MSRTRIACASVAALFFTLSSARAQPYDARAADWSATAGRTTGEGSNVLQAEVGWPGIGLTYLHALDDRSDVGARVNFVYGFESTTNSLAGVQFQVPYRRQLTDAKSMNVALHLDPGLTLYGNNGATLVGVGGPFGIVAGWRTGPQLMLDLGADFPILISFVHPAGFVFGPLFGAGAEYQVDQNLAVTLRARFGPVFAFATGQDKSQFGFQSLIGLAYNTR